MLAGAETSADELPPGGAVGPWVIARTLGSGGFGVVYEARHRETGARVALKVLHPRHTQDPTVRARFIREARAAAEVRHPNVVDVYDVGVADGAAFIAMRYLEGPTLADRIDGGAALSLHETLDLMLPILSAVQAAHDAGIVHRDLKPENIILARVDGAVRPTLLDFGIARFDGDGVGVTQTNMVFGTPHYMSPEQARDTKKASAQSDVWSLGVILFECATGRLPWPGDSLVDVQLKIMDSPEVSARALAPALPEGFDAALALALRRDPAERYPSVRALALALLPFARPATRDAWSEALGRPTTDRELAPVTTPAPRRPLAQTLAPEGEVETIAPAEAPARSPSRARRGLWIGAALLGLAAITAGFLVSQHDAPPAHTAVAPPPRPVVAPPPRPAVAPPPPPAPIPAPQPVAPQPVATQPPAVIHAPAPPRRVEENRPSRPRRPHTGVPIL